MDSRQAMYAFSWMQTPAAAAILTGIEWLTDGAGPGDVLVFHYSGHGSQVDDDSGDEWECRDEILVPYDHDWSNPLRDDDLKRRFDRVPPRPT